MTARFSMKRGKVDGTAFAHIMEFGEFHFHGVEDQALHEACTKVYLSYFNNQARVEGLLSAVHAPISTNQRVSDTFGRIVRLQALPDDLAFYHSNRNLFDLSTLCRDGASLFAELYAFFRNGLEFYSLAKQRGVAMIENLDRVMRELKRTEAVLTASGFHTQILTEEVVRRGYSVLAVTPRIDELEDDWRERFGRQLRGDRNETDELLASMGKWIAEHSDEHS
jgi:hypothetical protein